MYVVKNMGNFMYSKCMAARPMWFAHFGMGFCGGAQQLS